MQHITWSRFKGEADPADVPDILLYFDGFARSEISSINKSMT